jgi:hypothetical protein
MGNPEIQRERERRCRRDEERGDKRGTGKKERKRNRT